MANSLLEQVDAQLEALFAGWSIYTTLLCLLLGAYLIYPLVIYVEPDTHPMLLARQASNSYVRQPEESAVYRSLEAPQGYPLRSGLNVKDPGAPRWQAGRDGDLRDIWAQALKGPLDPEGNPSGNTGKVISVLGKEEVIEREVSEVTKDINSLGQYLVSQQVRRAAVYLPNSAEFLVSIFATTLYGLTPILVPFNTSLDFAAGILKESNADCMIAAAGSLPLDGLLQLYPDLKHVIWVAERSSRHMEWNEVPEGVGGKAEIGVWHEIVEEKRSSASAEVPPSLSDGVKPNIVTVSTSSKGSKTVEFSQANIVAAIAAQLSVLPNSQRLGSSDVLLSLLPLTDQYPLVLTLAALYSNSSIGLNSVSGPTTEYATAFKGIAPTIIVASPGTLSKYHQDRAGSPIGLLQRITRWRQARSLAAGSMPKAANITPKPRLIYTSEHSSDNIKSLTSRQISDIRVFTGAHIINAFTSEAVAGAVSQTNIFDYRIAEDGDTSSHFGAPLSCVEVKLLDMPESTDEQLIQGRLEVSGPAVAGDTTTVDNIMRITDNNTLSQSR